MSAKRLEGLLVPITTPFDCNGADVDAQSMASNVEALLGAGVDGIVVCGSTGEAALLEPDEQQFLVEIVRPLLPPDRWLIAGTGAESTRGTIALTRRAAAAGADAVMVRAPSYYGSTLSREALIDHFTAVADASPVPVLLYNIPKYTHFALAVEVIAALADHPRIHGLKDSSGDLDVFATYLEAAPRWRFFVGSLAHTTAAVGMGAAGGILAAACFLAEPIVKLIRQARHGTGDVSEARGQRFIPIAREIVGRMGIPGIKHAMDVVGLVGGVPRPPLRALGANDRQTVEALLAA